MTRLNYYDLRYLIVDYDIEMLQDYLRDLARKQQEEQGIEVVEATNDMILKMHSRK